MNPKTAKTKRRNRNRHARREHISWKLSYVKQDLENALSKGDPTEIQYQEERLAYWNDQMDCIGVSDVKTNNRWG